MLHLARMGGNAQVTTVSEDRVIALHFHVLGESSFRGPAKQSCAVLIALVGHQFQAEVKGEAAQGEHLADASDPEIQRVAPAKSKQHTCQDHDRESKGFHAHAGGLDPAVTFAKNLHEFAFRIRSTPPLFPSRTCRREFTFDKRSDTAGHGGVVRGLIEDGINALVLQPTVHLVLKNSRVYDDDWSSILGTKFNDEFPAIRMGQNQFGHDGVVPVLGNQMQRFKTVRGEVALEANLLQCELNPHLRMDFIINNEDSSERKFNDGNAF